MFHISVTEGGIQQLSRGEATMAPRSQVPTSSTVLWDARSRHQPPPPAALSRDFVPPGLWSAAQPGWGTWRHVQQVAKPTAHPRDTHVGHWPVQLLSVTDKALPWTAPTYRFHMKAVSTLLRLSLEAFAISELLIATLELDTICSAEKIMPQWKERQITLCSWNRTPD